ncbi:MAG TPA: hypothetical protein VD772_11745, partial [Anseongella sp.]|nr:hypothetical protein [Anseongella sp.]
MSKENLSRRKALSVFGLGGLTLASGSLAFPAAASAPSPGKAGSPRRYGSVAEMCRDTALEEGMLAEVTGYYAPGDGGGGAYLVRKSPGSGKAGALSLENGLWAGLANITSVNYKMFGARGDKQHDDGEQIKAAHAYANQQGLPVINLSGEFWIRETKSIPILGNVSWGHTVFHIEERFNTQKEPRFEILSREPLQEIRLEGKARAGFLSKLKPGVKIIPELAPYRNCLVIVSDEDDRIGFRSGRPGQSWAR